MSNEIVIRIQKPYPRQQEFLDARKRNNLLILSRRWGKTTISKIVVAVDSIKIPGYRAAWASPTFKLMLETFEEFIEVLKPITKRLNRDDRRIQLTNGSVIEFWSSNDPQALRGRKYNVIVLDEMQRQRNLTEFIYGSCRPCLADLRGTLYVLGTANGEGTDFHKLYLDAKSKPENWQVAHGSLNDNPFIAPEEIAMMREDLGPLLSAQELDSLWINVSGLSPLISKYEWDNLYGIPEGARPQKVLSLDASISNDTTGLIAPWRDVVTQRYSVDYDDILLFKPTLEDPETGTLQIDFLELENVIWRMWQTGKYAALVYDPYQCVSMAQRLRRRGVRTIDFPQMTLRIKSDSYLRQVLNDGMFSHPNHTDLNEHIRNATIHAQTNSSGVRIVKSDKNKKIDLAVALSMAVYAMTTLNPGIVEKYTPGVAAYGKSESINPSAQQYSPISNIDKYSPFNKR